MEAVAKGSSEIDLGRMLSDKARYLYAMTIKGDNTLSLKP